uniref:DUF4249 family protein n=1 Tax=Flavobacterium sp. TaxID=239 RepID=UPI00404AA877
MKKYIIKPAAIKQVFCFIILIFSLSSCEDVIDVELDTAAPRLVVEASIDWEKGTDGSYQKIKLTTTTDYFGTEIPTVSNAIVSITNLNSGQIFTFLESASALGLYECFDFVPIIENEYEITIVYENQTYKASEALISVPEIELVEQSTIDAFGTELIEIKYFFQDNPDENNFYFSSFTNPNYAIPIYDVDEDRFTQGNLMFGLEIDEELKAGDDVTIALYGVNEQYFNYMRILLSIAGGGGGGPFEAPPSTVRGNLVNQDNFDNFCLGYFRLSEVDAVDYTIQ